MIFCRYAEEHDEGHDDDEKGVDSHCVGGELEWIILKSYYVSSRKVDRNDK